MQMSGGLFLSVSLVFHGLASPVWFDFDGLFHQFALRGGNGERPVVAPTISGRGHQCRTQAGTIWQRAFSTAFAIHQHADPRFIEQLSTGGNTHALHNGRFRKRDQRKVLESLSPQERLEGLSPEERLKGLSPEERLEGLSSEELLTNLPPEEIERYLKKLKEELSEPQ